MNWAEPAVMELEKHRPAKPGFRVRTSATKFLPQVDFPANTVPFPFQNPSWQEALGKTKHRIPLWVFPDVIPTVGRFCPDHSYPLRHDETFVTYIPPLRRLAPNPRALRQLAKPLKLVTDRPTRPFPPTEFSEVMAPREREYQISPIVQESVVHNTKSLTNLQSLAATLFGISAGILGLESYSGFIFYFAFYLIITGLFFLLRVLPSSAASGLSPLDTSRYYRSSMEFWTGVRTRFVKARGVLGVDK
ncbi:Rab5-interacting protein-domain-containing protein [Zalerion maritima]|uniref:ER membrane protein complex subunit 6 n=1 Tax=Zalerion maritima TaxID=339359 RepID=A0AAD5RNU5_9PEZI|nr:Rab5-interacting protein-domain-containing protein [Zalerion maritima]